MAVQLFKDGGHIYVEPNKLQAHLASGYSLVDPKSPHKAHPPEIYPERLRGIEKLPAKEQEKLVLAEMGIVEIVHPVSTPLVAMPFLDVREIIKAERTVGMSKPTPPPVKPIKKKVVSKKAVKRVAN